MTVRYAMSACMETLGGFPYLPAMVRRRQSRRASHATCLLLIVALAGACERTSLNSGHADASAHGRDGSPTVEVSPRSQPPSGGRCPAGFSGCVKGDGLRCYDLSQSQDHCGACGNACAQGIACQAGTCQQYRCKGALSFKTLVFGSAGVAQALGDFDGDGILDLVGSAEAGGPMGDPMGGPMTLLYGAGDGTFPTQQVIDPASLPRIDQHNPRPRGSNPGD